MYVLRESMTAPWAAFNEVRWGWRRRNRGEVSPALGQT